MLSRSIRLNDNHEVHELREKQQKIFVFFLVKKKKGQ